MNKGSISLLALMVALGSSESLQADAKSALSKLNLGHNSSSPSSTQNEAKLKKQISQLKTEVLTLRQALKDPSLQKDLSDLQTNIDKIEDGTPQSIIFQLQVKIEKLKKKNQELKAAAPIVHSNDPATKAHISKLEAEIAKLRLQLSQGGKPTIDPEAEKKVAEAVTTYIDNITQELNDKTTKLNIHNFRELLDRVESTGSVQLLLELESKILELTTNSPHPEKLEGINGILEKSDVLKELHQQQAKNHFESLAELGKQRLQNLTNLLTNDPNYFKKSPLAILIFMNKSAFDFSIIQKSLSSLSNLFNKTPQADIQAIYSYLHNIGIDPMKTSFSSNFMKSISQLINSQAKDSNGLSEKEFEKLVKINRNQLLDLVNNIADTELKVKLTKMLEVSKEVIPNSSKQEIVLDTSPQALIYFKALEDFPYLKGEASIIGANAIIEKLNKKSTASPQEKASVAINGINEFFKSIKKGELTTQQQKDIRDKLKTIKPAQVVTGPGVPPPPPSSSGSKGKIYEIGEIIQMGTKPKEVQQFIDDILATIKNRETAAQAEINKNKNRAKDIQRKLTEQSNDLDLNSETILAAAYAVLSCPEGMTNKTIRARIANIISPTMKTALFLDKALKEIYP